MITEWLENLELWQVPLLVMLVLAIPVIIYEVAGRRVSDPARTRLRGYGLLILSVIMLVLLVFGVRTFGTSSAADVATVASAVIELIILWLAVVTFQEQRRLKPGPDRDLHRQ